MSGGHGGFPSDWWSNGRSPLPAYLAGLVLQRTGCEDASAWLRESSASEADHVLYWRLHERHGFGVFARALRTLREDDVNLGEIEPPWPHPNAVRSAYTIADPSLAAGENLTDLITARALLRAGRWREADPSEPNDSSPGRERVNRQGITARLW